ncbi:hypothetical protein [Streptomyces luteolus]|uniref:Uncharacterized protein n=1 Tax=Streptomyces luteolus TaxID=3043615 RepID=A0ABT6SZ64_9ACTN|nr:hypothetical protein [Streptomyces sp. B-S-A12]MDI3420902.1 hypothetical protein [Streptomyces sp. B-S-A12]
MIKLNRIAYGGTQNKPTGDGSTQSVERVVVNLTYAYDESGVADQVPGTDRAGLFLSVTASDQSAAGSLHLQHGSEVTFDGAEHTADFTVTPYHGSSFPEGGVQAIAFFDAADKDEATLHLSR